MRKSCELKRQPEGITCNEPAVDFITLTDGRQMWLCAHHYDRWIAIATALKRAEQERNAHL
jgi:hypothetical protein